MYGYLIWTALTRDNIDDDQGDVSEAPGTRAPGRVAYAIGGLSTKHMQSTSFCGTAKTFKLYSGVRCMIQ